MSKSNGSRLFGGNKTATVVESNVVHTTARKAKIALMVTALAVGLLSMTVASASMHAILALALGLVVGFAAGCVAWFAVIVWPYVRMTWWWATEILLAFVLVYGWMVLVSVTNLTTRLLVVALLAGVLAGIPAVRRRVVALAWCIIVRHRLRVAFHDFIKANQHGTLPLILWAHPTLVGERVWIYLRSGLSKAELDARLDMIAVACHASAVLVEKASDRNAAFVRVDVKRREVLTATITSPLVDQIDPQTPTTPRVTFTPPTGLDLGDEPAPVRTVPYTPDSARPGKPSTNGKTTVAAGGDAVPDWL